jgi:hypothetical protein
LAVPICDSSSSFSQRRRLAQYIQQPEPNEALASSRWNCLGKPWHVSYCGLLKETSTASRSRAASCSVVWGFGFRRTGLWAHPRPGALGGALVMPGKSCSGSVLPPPKFPGVAMESCLVPGAPAVPWALTQVPQIVFPTSASSSRVAMAGYRITPVLGFWT